MTIQRTPPTTPTRTGGVPDASGVRGSWRVEEPVDGVEAYCDALWGDMAWPAALWQVLAHADGQGIGLATRREVSDLPRRLYNGLDDLARALRTHRGVSRRPGGPAVRT